MKMTESTVEAAALEWLQAIGYTVAYGPEIAPEEALAERDSFGEVVLRRRLREAVARLNPSASTEALEAGVNKVLRLEGAATIDRHRLFHRYLARGVDVEYRDRSGDIRGEHLRLLDYDDPTNNDWLAVNQFTVIEAGRNRRPDLVVFLNGLPVGLFELKDAVNEKATVWDAFRQLQTYKKDIPSIFNMAELLIISDGFEARMGSLTSEKEWFMPWRTIEGETLAPAAMTQLEVLVRGVFDKHRLLDYLRYFVVFEQSRSGVAKKLAGYHQFHAVTQAVEQTVRAASGGGDGRAGVIWHTQGSGKSLTMAFYAGRIAVDARLQNPTVVVITDRNDLDGQLFGVFARCSELFGQEPSQADSATQLRELLAVASGGVVFTTVQKFLPDETTGRHPLLSDRRNIIVIADEAHRSQYGFTEGFARRVREALPNATFLGFTGTPIELADRSTRAVFGDYISIYDIQRAIDDGATVKIYYEGRLAKLHMPEKVKEIVDSEFDEVMEDQEASTQKKLKTKWAALEAIVGADDRLELVAKDLVQHFDSRLAAMEGKAMVVCMSRRIAVRLYEEIVAIRPEWHNGDDALGEIKVVMTGSASDPEDWQQHIRNKARREELADRFKDPDDRFKLVIVRDMWLTGFDAPSLHTMYLDKPMRGHGLMQTIARVNRVFRDKPGGLVVDYLGLGNELREALATYTQSGGKGQSAVPIQQALVVLKEKFEVSRNILHGFDYSLFKTGSAAEQLSIRKAALEFVLSLPDGKNRLLKAVSELSRAFALCVPDPTALALRDDVRFFQEIRGALAKRVLSAEQDPEDLDHAVRQIVSKAIVGDEIMDIFQAAGLPKPDISILSDGFLADVRQMPQKNLAVEVLQRLIRNEVKRRAKKNLVKSMQFSEMLEISLKRYENRAIEAAQVIEELIALAKEMKAAEQRGEDLGLTDDELAFYDALGTNDSAVQVLGDDTLRGIARELVRAVRQNTTIDWTTKESIRAKLRLLVKKILKKYGYPPDKQEAAADTVLKQAELLSEGWALEAPVA
jgi:type I restriction enzyme, R subunit